MRFISKRNLNEELKALKKTFLGLIDIIEKMHKHSIEDYKNVISCEMDEEIIDSTKFEKEYSVQFHLMFFDIAEEFKYRLRTLKRELIKKLDVKKIKMKELKAIVKENESFGEPDPKLDNESIKKIMEYINSNTKLNFIPEESESENESIKKSQEHIDSNSKDTAEDTALSMMKRE